jgi:tetratricopeptide (TPR) repeat protein
MKMKLLLLLLIFAGYVARAQYSDLLHKTYAERRPMLRGYYIHELLGGTDAARLHIQNIVSAIAAVADKNNDEDLALEAALMQLHIDIKWHLYDSYMGLKKLDSLRLVAISKHRLWLKARVESLAALVCVEAHEQGNYELCFDYLYKLRNTLQTVTIEEFPEKQICYGQIGKCYYECHDLASAIKYCKEGMTDTPSDPEDDWGTRIISFVGVCYRDIGQPDSADVYFRKALRSLKFTRPTDNQWLGIINGYMGHNYYLQKNYAAATPCLQTCLDTAIAYNDRSLAGTALTDLGAIDLATGKTTEAVWRIYTAAEYLRQSGYYKGWLDLYPVLAKLQTALGKHAEATKYLDSFIAVKDSVDRKFNATLITGGTRRAELQEKKELEDEAAKKVIERNFLLAFVVVLMGLSIYIYISQRNKYRQKELIKNLELHQKQAELDFASTQLDDFARDISAKNKRVEELQEKLGTSVDEELLTQLQQSTILTDDEWDRFRKLFAQVHGGYLVRLKEKLPRSVAGRGPVHGLGQIKIL